MATERIPRPAELVVEELTEQLEQTRRLLLKGTGAVVDRSFQQFQDDAATERAIAADLADRKAVAQPEQFPDSHRSVIHALEVLERHGSSGIQVGRFIPLNPAKRRTTSVPPPSDSARGSKTRL